MQYGNTPVSPYTGNADVSVPVYTYKDYEFDVPVELKYVFRGFKPNEPAGSFGLGWVLNAGGCITRDVKHYGDETSNLELGREEGQWGFYRMYEYEKEVPTINSSKFNVEPVDAENYFYPMSSGKIEAEPDIFSFNFLGHSGKFMFWANKRIVVLESSQPQGLYMIEPVVEYFRITGFKIRTRDGYIYTFGGKELDPTKEMQYFDYVYNSWRANYNGPAVMWPLISVQAPSGRTLKFEYARSDQYVTTVRPMSYIVDTVASLNGPRHHDWMHVAYINRQKQKPIYLKKITLAGTFSIDFSYSSERSESYHDPNKNLQPMLTEGVLQSVTVKNLSDNSIVKTAGFTYASAAPSTIPLLIRVHLSDTGDYEFSYWQDLAQWACHKGTCAVDHWGYSNGKSDNNISKFFPSSRVVDNKETITSSERNPNFKYAVCGALRYIYYPTRGRTEFIYEPNEYSVAVVKSSRGQGCPYGEDYDTNQTAGGIRIKQIIDYDYNSVQGGYTVMRTRSYGYEIDGISTGILLRTPQYRTSVVRCITPSSSLYKQTYVASSDILDCIDTDHHIEYSSVVETYKDGAFCKYEYSTYATPRCGGGASYPDDMALAYDTNYPIYGDGTPYLYMRPGSRKALRGKLISKTFYQAKLNPEDRDIPTYSEGYQYSGLGQRFWAILKTRYYWYERPIFSGSCQLSRVFKTKYFNGKAVTEQIGYHYDSDTGYPTQIEKRNASGKYTRQEIHYASGNDGSPLSRSPYPIMTCFQVQNPEENLWRTTEVNKYLYTSIRVTPTFSLPILKEHWQTHLDRPKVYASEEDYADDLILEDSLMATPARVYQHTDRSGNVTAFLYGEGGCNLLAVVRNVSYNEALQAMGNPHILGRYTLTPAQEAALRSIPGAVVTSYSYTPLVGLASETGPSGSMQTYYYDAHNRLESIYGGATNLPRHLEKKYKYQIFNVN